MPTLTPAQAANQQRMQQQKAAKQAIAAANKEIQKVYKDKVNSINVWANQARKAAKGNKVQLNEINVARNNFLKDANIWLKSAQQATREQGLGIAGLPMELTPLPGINTFNPQVATAVNPVIQPAPVDYYYPQPAVSVATGQPIQPSASGISGDQLASLLMMMLSAGGGGGAPPAYAPAPAPQADYPGYAPLPGASIPSDEVYSPPAYPVYSPVVSLWPGEDFFNPSMEYEAPPAVYYAPSSASALPDGSGGDVTMVSPEILDALMQEQSNYGIVDPWTGAFNSYGRLGYASQVPLVAPNPRRPARRMKRNMTMIQAMNAMPILVQDFGAFEWLAPVINAAGQVGSAAIQTALAPKLGNTQASAQPIYLPAPAPAPSPISPALLIGGGLAGLLILVVALRK